ncbi:hypothetical protein MKZ38_006245 [Zalerion maritima]|uniref:Uncharacterized protein n=1 Tax=Zalerion maritima TaxID=339359 RepID=A0AAD5RJ36_9PEZI|nr:hypothetical protein MKZ38_006245 [Zalerion maritima]
MFSRGSQPGRVPFRPGRNLPQTEQEYQHPILDRGTARISIETDGTVHVDGKRVAVTYNATVTILHICDFLARIIGKMPHTEVFRCALYLLKRTHKEYDDNLQLYLDIDHAAHLAAELLISMSLAVDKYVDDGDKGNRISYNWRMRTTEIIDCVLDPEITNTRPSTMDNDDSESEYETNPVGDVDILKGLPYIPITATEPLSPLTSSSHTSFIFEKFDRSQASLDTNLLRGWLAETLLNNIVDRKTYHAIWTLVSFRINMLWWSDFFNRVERELNMGRNAADPREFVGIWVDALNQGLMEDIATQVQNQIQVRKGISSEGSSTCCDELGGGENRGVGSAIKGEDGQVKPESSV